MIGAALVMDKWNFQATMSSRLEGAEDRTAIGGVRVFASGSSAEDASLYQAIESAGALVVGEDHDFGYCSFEQLVPETDDPLDGIAQAYGGGAPAASWGAIAARAEYTLRCACCSGAEAVLSVLFDHDEALVGPAGGSRQALAEVGIPLIEIGDALGSTDRVGRTAGAVLRRAWGRGTVSNSGTRSVKGLDVTSAFSA